MWRCWFLYSLRIIGEKRDAHIKAIMVRQGPKMEKTVAESAWISTSQTQYYKWRDQFLTNEHQVLLLRISWWRSCPGKINSSRNHWRYEGSIKKRDECSEWTVSSHFDRAHMAIVVPFQKDRRSIFGSTGVCELTQYAKVQEINKKRVLLSTIAKNTNNRKMISLFNIHIGTKRLIIHMKGKYPDIGCWFLIFSLLYYRWNYSGHIIVHMARWVSWKQKRKDTLGTWSIENWYLVSWVFLGWV